METTVTEDEALVGVTVKVEALLATLATVTMTLSLPTGAELGTEVAMLDAPQLLIEAATPPTVTVLLPCVDPNPEPEMVNGVPAGPVAVERLVMWGATVKE